ncbi:hypothetical protein E2C01_077282 [Portunus trituberculatus]|uniref:Uncharacterized protein n=1 Tax=Portunus trituberculatus TaxID=210409 RepID=A0A5B7ILR7_PORTR|nr:hypothetical protein [Portunus trituberculatus]
MLKGFPLRQVSSLRRQYASRSRHAFHKPAVNASFSDFGEICPEKIHALLSVLKAEGGPDSAE